MNNIFYKIVTKKVKIDLIYEDEMVIAFNDINPISSTHILILPKTFIATLDDIQLKHEKILGRMLFVITKIAKQKHLDRDGYRVVINCKQNGGQEIFYLHMHLLGGRKGIKKFY
ncbi:HIT domain-containing protein [Enterobacteriaceae endosymbiont of Macroplea appendiculata]|uniref:HIT domain-containing protein n=1 Tax=Enterobacteriaceae endosymbiont of Macroplea appendiculata TaxID=2675790 RepID=UPI001449082E|nr:HIT domain-containing protein [Enterobacteriaceae endosymbiont of Macroplea appendiculata]QJC30713.1 HIT domain-containing protein [Enterobacteriaceae endosymbiont of Macroplea appendiculata]